MESKFLARTGLCLALLAWVGGSAAEESVGGTRQEPASGLPRVGSPLTVELPTLPDPEPDSDFQYGMTELGPMSPAQIKQLRRYRDDTERAHASLPRFQPKPVYSDLPVSLHPTPGSAPQMVRVFVNFQTNVLFYDDYGNPLPIVHVTTPPKDDLDVTWSEDPENPTNSMQISPLKMYANGSVSVKLEGVPGRVSLLLASGQREVDIDARVRVKGVGKPHVVAGAGVSVPQDVDPVMLALLTGVPPDRAKQLRTSNGNIQAWRVGNDFYVRVSASFTLLSPAATAIQRGSDGSSIYKIQPAPVLVALTGGETVSINLSGY